VGRRVGTAVVRNRLRRRIRAVMRELAPDLENGAYLVSATEGATTLSPVDLRDAISRATRQALARREGRPR
jgi:ribonuclease P protein component